MRFYPTFADEGNRQSQFPFLISLVSGAIVGAISARFFLQDVGVRMLSGLFTGWDSVSFLRRLFLTVLFPSLVFGGALSGCAPILALLFFWKGVFFSFILCVCVNCGVFPARAAVYRALFFRSIMPLPACFYSASVLLNQSDAAGSALRLRLLFLNLVSCFLCLGMEAAANVVF